MDSILHKTDLLTTFDGNNYTLKNMAKAHYEERRLIKFKCGTVYLITDEDVEDLHQAHKDAVKLCVDAGLPIGLALTEFQEIYRLKILLRKIHDTRTPHEIE